MQDRRLLIIATLTLGLLMNYPSAAQSLPSNKVPHTGMSQQALEHAYVESYEQSGFRLTSRHKQSSPAGYWKIELVFQFKSAQKGSDAPGTTLTISGYKTTGCPCLLSRESFRGPDADNPDSAAVARGERVLIKADTAALAKVRKRLGMSLPAIDMPTP
ncbi:hypothetical protein [Xanthomonas arboricola]|uniref:hypothetical protein n=2 Tax=Xanthomonas arboricola TaxID=56448 RepID=UPI000F8F5C33|nr:hypothetical protein [Xanthomonas arboricola]MBB3849766.1 hypothetical protein [Xanthomonas arboricola]NIK32940.1 hypothetical protein [Xanthomonas arboricola]NJC01657.1 hypothetical protein [Xanthomonas arboricola]CAD7381597.1 hypothetical protein X12_002277 [Xanthomonas arboricola]